ncbi:unnamed protein product [Mytilus edulis]|uniref:CCHC-type domain-containing protein n=1 Tax=Mytilus edulis TaxID=6550 RepID=A0A8S3UV60_MYTED|nr:unnamed protein product [Mytilus edulis]
MDRDKDKDSIQCFYCKKNGHKKDKCPEKGKQIEPPQVHQRLKWYEILCQEMVILIFRVSRSYMHYFEERDRKQMEEKEERVQKLKELIESTSSDSETENGKKNQKKKKRKHSHSLSDDDELKMNKKRKKSKHKKVKRLKTDKMQSSDNVKDHTKNKLNTRKVYSELLTNYS